MKAHGTDPGPTEQTPAAPGSDRRRGSAFRTSLPVIATAGVVLLAGGWFLRANWRVAALQPQKERPAAEVGGEVLYEKDFVPSIEGKLYKIRMQEYELKRQTLETEISKKLVQAEAAKRGITEEELVRQEVDARVPEPTEAEIEEQFVAQMFRGQPAQKDQIREQVKQQKMQQARQDYFATLRAQAGAKIYLLPPRLEVGFDPSRVRGNPDAPITMVEFSDFQCPYCLQAYTTVRSLLAKYEGKVKLAYRDLPLLGAASGAQGSAGASRCAGEQGKFWEFHDLLFENQDYFGMDAFREYAEGLGLDVAKLTACIESGKYEKQIQEDFQEGLRLGITGTPGFFINGIFVNGARPQPEFEEIIDIELATMDQ
jgi:protein-disulfide isomerase